jgi:hypothetical protein
MASAVEHTVKRALSAYRKEPGSAAKPSAGTTTGSGSTSAKKQAGSQQGTEAPSYDAKTYLEAAAVAVGEVEALKRIVKELKKSAPEVADALGW